MKKIFGWFFIVGGVIGTVRWFFDTIIGGTLTALITCIAMLVLGIWMINSSKSKEKDMSLKDILKDKCNPANFMKPYDEKKIEIANDIYKELIITYDFDFKSLKKLRKKAIEELGISFISEEYIKKLKDKCNPERFTKPYFDINKVKTANRLLQQIADNENDIDVLEAIEKEICEYLSKENN